MKFNDAVFGLILLVLGAAVLAVVQGYPKIPGQQVGPALFPGLIATGLCVCGAMLLLKGLRERATVQWFHFDEWIRSPRHALAFAITLLSVVFYILVSERLGFVLTSVLILLALMWSLRVPAGRSVAIAVIATLLIHAAFYKLLRVPLPWGVLTPYAW
ncbi:tripartite tricarboxylate transporter TctB family protein [Variovorax sp. RT4R15]|uniref:tripartite tricarboxylate transporter TctB family protein n=1 Tax=Variovorax sp. RT4R15 TaxID=3443737 RepID=UPI003F478F2B